MHVNTHIYNHDMYISTFARVDGLALLSTVAREYMGTLATIVQF